MGSTDEHSFDAKDLGPRPNAPFGESPGLLRLSQAMRQPPSSVTVSCQSLPRPSHLEPSSRASTPRRILDTSKCLALDFPRSSDNVLPPVRSRDRTSGHQLRTRMESLLKRSVRAVASTATSVTTTLAFCPAPATTTLQDTEQAPPDSAPLHNSPAYRFAVAVTGVSLPSSEGERNTL